MAKNNIGDNDKSTSARKSSVNAGNKKTIDKKHLEEMAELDRRVVIDEPTDNYEDEDDDQTFVL